jgi:hypothetical protein
LGTSLLADRVAYSSGTESSGASSAAEKIVTLVCPCGDRVQGLCIETTDGSMPASASRSV